MAYCIYTAASVRVQKLSVYNDDTTSSLSVFLRALKGGLSTCPVLSRSLEIINNSLGSLKARNEQSTVAEVDLAGNSYLPAFPAYDLQMNPAEIAGAGPIDQDAFMLLDCFPESHIDAINNDWYIPT